MDRQAGVCAVVRSNGDDQQIRNLVCARICVQDAVGRTETGETQKTRDHLAQQKELNVRGARSSSRVDIGPEASQVRHTYPGEKIIYILAESLEYQIEGQPPKTFNAGYALTAPVESFSRPARRKARNPAEGGQHGQFVVD